MPITPYNYTTLKQEASAQKETINWTQGNTQMNNLASNTMTVSSLRPIYHNLTLLWSLTCQVLRYSTDPQTMNPSLEHSTASPQLKMAMIPQKSTQHTIFTCRAVKPSTSTPPKLYLLVITPSPPTQKLTDNIIFLACIKSGKKVFYNNNGCVEKIQDKQTNL